MDLRVEMNHYTDSRIHFHMHFWRKLGFHPYLLGGEALDCIFLEHSKENQDHHLK